MAHSTLNAFLYILKRYFVDYLFVFESRTLSYMQQDLLRHGFISQTAVLMYLSGLERVGIETEAVRLFSLSIALSSLLHVSILIAIHDNTYMK